MVAGGVGLAPFATLAEALAERGTPMTLFYGGRSASDLYYEPFFERLGAQLVLTTEDGSLGERGRVTLPLEQAVDGAAADQPITIYACGPTPMMRAVAASAPSQTGRCSCRSSPSWAAEWAAATVASSRSYAADGTHFVRSCLEGPVFDASDVAWDALAGGH